MVQYIKYMITKGLIVMKASLIKEKLATGNFAENLIKLYGDDTKVIELQAQRYIKAVEEFEKFYGEDRDIAIYSASGRTEICGNHTDHNCGLIAAAAITQDTLCIASKKEEKYVHVASEGYGEIPPVNLEKLRALIDDEGTTKGLVKGVCAEMIKRGGNCGGLDLYITSDVLKGSGLSSSAAFEVVIATAVNHEYCDGRFTPVEIAQIGQKAENDYFGKPCGVMDQSVSAVGGCICLDLEDLANPKVKQLPLDLDKFDLALCTVDCGASHDDLTEEYAGMPSEMKQIASFFMADSLRRLDLPTIVNHASFLRPIVGDRAVLRAMHFFMECKRVEDLCTYIEKSDREMFIRTITDSGHSSYEYLQNAYVPSQPKNQAMAVALATAQSFLADKGGAWRLQGGGFAGSIQCFVPKSELDKFIKYMETVFGEGCCQTLSIRHCGSVKVTD